jgi:hypothetical protein
VTTFPGAPEPPKPDTFKPSEQTGSLVGFRVLKFDEQAETPWGARPQVVVDVTVIVGRDQGKHWTDLQLSGTLLAPQLGQCVGREVYGRMAERPGGRNANPPMFLADLWPGDQELLAQWRQAGGGISNWSSTAATAHTPPASTAPPPQPAPGPEMPAPQRSAPGPTEGTAAADDEARREFEAWKAARAAEADKPPF